MSKSNLTIDLLQSAAMTPDEQIGQIVYRSPDRRRRDERALMLRAIGIDYITHSAAGEHFLIVPARDANRAAQELAAYENENKTAPAPPVITFSHPDRITWPGLLTYIFLMPTFYYMQEHLTGGVDWLIHGKTHAGMILAGQVWRTVTALTLHADVAHLIANLIIGGLFAHFVSQRLGSGVAWFGIVIGGALGNLINAVIQPPDHASIGASTAIFAALGITSAIVWRSKSRQLAAPWVRWAPIIAAVILLTFLGTGGERTDVAAHVTGFGSGILLGIIVAAIERRLTFGTATQIILGLLTLALIAAAWTAAIM